MFMDNFDFNINNFLFFKVGYFFNIIKSKQNLIYLFISGFLIFMNWGVWIYAIATNRIIDASFGYFIMPILSVLLGYIFFKEKLNNKRIFSITLVILSILYLIFVSLKSLPWVGILVALSWGPNLMPQVYRPREAILNLQKLNIKLIK